MFEKFTEQNWFVFYLNKFILGLYIHIGPLHNLIKMKKIIMVFSVLKNEAPANLYNLFEFVNDMHNVPTRSSITDLKVHKVTTEFGKSKYFIVGQCCLTLSQTMHLRPVIHQ